MQKHGIILDMSCDKLTFWPGHCQHSGGRQATNVKKLLAQIQKEKPHAEPHAEPRAKPANSITPKYILPAK